MRILYQSIRKITNKILGVKGLTTTSDQERNSPHSVSALSSRQEMGIKKDIHKEIIS